LPPPPCQRRPPLHDAVAALGNWKVSYFWDWSINHQFLIFCFLKIPDVFLVVPIKIPMSHHILWVSAPATSEKKTKPIALARQPLAPPFHMTGRASQWYRRNFPRVASQRSGGRLKLLLLCFAVGSMQVGTRRHTSEIAYVLCSNMAGKSMVSKCRFQWDYHWTKWFSSTSSLIARG
jgi:hypothetical protein